MKSIREIIAEKDDQFEYYVKSTADIHAPEIFGQIKLGLAGYKLRSLEKDSYKPLMKDNVDFPREPNSPVYVLKAVTALPINKKAAEDLIAVYANINTAHLLIQEIGKEGEEDREYPVSVGNIHQKNDYKPYTDRGIDLDWNADPHDSIPPDIQDKVGFQRIADLMKELEAGRKDREENEFRVRDVYESFSATHMMLEHAIKTPLRKGYYIVETYGAGTHVQATIEGPFEFRPDNLPFRDNVFGKVAEANILKNEQNDGRTVIEVAITGYEPAMEEPNLIPHCYQIAVRDGNSGRIYRTIVREMSLPEAKEVAIKQIAQRNNVAVETLVALEGRESD